MCAKHWGTTTGMCLSELKSAHSKRVKFMFHLYNIFYQDDDFEEGLC